MANFFGTLINAAKQTLAGDVMQTAGQFDMVEIPSNQLRSNDIYGRCFDENLIPDGLDTVHVLHHSKSGKYHVACRFQSGNITKVFSVYRDTKHAHIIDVANRFRKLAGLLILTEKEDTLKSLITCIHSHPTWENAHYAAAVGISKFFVTLRGGGAQATKQLITPDPVTGLLPLHIAVDNNRVEVVDLLLSLGADVNAIDLNGMNAFHNAAGVNAAVVQALSKHHNSATAVNAMNNSGRTPLFIAVVLGKPDCVVALVGAGAVGTIRCEGKTVLEAALKSSSIKKVQLVQIVSKSFPTLVVEPDASGSTPLHYCDDPKILRLLVHTIGNNEAYMNIRDGNGETPLHCAVRRADLSAVVCFIAHGSPIDAKNPDGRTALHLSLSLVIQAGQLQILKALLSFGASCAMVDAEGRLPRHFVACTLSSSHRAQVMQILETIEADRCPPDQTGCVDACRYREPDSISDDPIKLSGLHEMRQQWCVDWVKKKKQNENAKYLNLLSLDGGGVRGVVLIQILLALEKLVGPGKLLDRFDWVAGTSTGAIMAAAFCQGRSLRDIQGLYFRLKDVVFDGTSRPYNNAVLEQFLKEELGHKCTVGDIVKPRLLLTTARADINPIKLVLIRNYRLPLSLKENEALGYEDPKTWPLWKAARCSSAAPTYFSSVDNKFVDGGLVANNPTLDLLTEVSNYEFARRISQNDNDERGMEIGCVVSVGCGEAPVAPVMCSVDVGMPTGIMDALGAVFAAKNLGDILISQVTATGGRPVDRAQAWCHTMNVPFFRFSPILFKDVPLDDTDDATLVQLLWCTIQYLHENRAQLQTLVDLLK